MLHSPPFDTVPRGYDDYTSIFGRDSGVIQWEGFRDHYDSLVELMRARNWYMAYQRAAELGHYVADATCPLHCTVHYDGYQPWHPLYDERNEGIHSRYEGDMVDTLIADLWYSSWIDAGQPSFTPAAIFVNFQPTASDEPSGWGAAGPHPFGPFGTFGWM